MIDQHTLEILEFPKVVARIRDGCLTPYGREQTAHIGPMFEQMAIETRLHEVEQLRDIYRFGEAFPLYQLDDCRDLLHSSAIEGDHHDPVEIRVVLELVKMSISLHEYDREHRDRFPQVVPYLSLVRSFPELRDEINRVVDEDAQVRDTASVQLRRIRNNLADARRRIIARLESILSKQQKHAGWQDDVITQRNDRYVIPVLAGEYRASEGILHDRSQSGATLYVEPRETVELNNRVSLLFQEERAEVIRILRALTAEIGQRADALLASTQVIGKLDALYSAAKLGAELQATRPRIEPQTRLDIHDARHPLLILQLQSVEQVVPLTLQIDKDRQAVLITGPNTGGKTIALKTIGLLTVMAQSGLLVPALETSTFGIFDRVYADIGDEQSIELSLSTFSSHIRNISQAVANVSDQALVLLDEIGAGTDPKEGAALAEAIILHIVKRGARVVASTHYSQLKTLALDHPEIENASLEFDRQTLKPTFRLQMGIPGSSYAVEIAGRLGIPGSICDHAAQLLGSSERSLSELIASLETELKQVRQDRAGLTERLSRVEALEREYRSRMETVDAEIEQRRQAALNDTDQLLESTRRELEHMVAEIRKTQAEPNQLKQAHQFIRTASDRVNQTRTKADPGKTGKKRLDKFFEKDTVRVLSLNQIGTIAELIGDDRARVQMGGLTTVVGLRDLEKVTDKPRPIGTKFGAKPSTEDLSPEIHLRGMTVEDAIEALDKFLDAAVVAGLHQVYVVHGKGTGALRRSLTEYLQQHREVESLRLGNWNEGGAGVTIVKLRS